MPTTPTRSWQPILEGGLQAQALDAVAALGRALTRPALSPDSEVRRASLASGQAGLAVLYGYLASAGADTRHTEIANYFLDSAIDALGAVQMPPALFEGFTGIAWTLAHLEGRVIEPSTDDLNAEIDSALGAYVGQQSYGGDYDLIGGLVGLGVYALERLPRAGAVRLLEHVVDRLADQARRTPAGVTWWTSPELLPLEDRAAAPRGFYNLGIAHGVPGVVALLAQAAAAGIRPAAASSLAREGVAWILAQAAPGDGARFVYWIGEDTRIVDSNVAWCYGDLGVAAALACAARALDEPTWLEQAAALARHTARRPVGHARAHYPGLCHGTAGIAHVFNRLYHATGDATLRSTARDWFARTLALRNSQPGGVAGFSTEQQPGEQADDPGLLGGTAGIALALLAAATPIEPAWDRMLLISPAVTNQEASA